MELYFDEWADIEDLWATWEESEQARAVFDLFGGDDDSSDYDEL